eukprot:gnl/TRDRNA2_/TRDRNA2_64170_c0_seq1.p1 gnl/TRDRNA2_/TRDRNA2_64170_c0~~gnl/TRDRNA2_/TRDRNA2_64170_c0_seq1.p1  ORF type:complete len:284 (+),score=46.11 gnl/TRDRNA2_/TRDRNA2_64170_c0_seq1:57-908(+)
MALLTRRMIPRQEHLRWSSEFESELVAREVEQAIQAAVGCLTYHTSSWQQLASAIDANPDSLVQEVEARIPEEELERDSGDIQDVRLLILRGEPGLPPPEASQQSSSGSMFSSESCMSSRPNIVDVFFNPVDRIMKHRFAEQSVKFALHRAQDDALKRGDTYLFEIDRLTTCREQSWESSVVLLEIRKSKADIVVTLFLLPGSAEDDICDVQCTSLGGNVLAVLRLEAHSTCREMRANLAKRLEVPRPRVKLVLQDGGIVDFKQDDNCIADIFSSAYAHRRGY